MATTFQPYVKLCDKQDATALLCSLKIWPNKKSSLSIVAGGSPSIKQNTAFLGLPVGILLHGSGNANHNSDVLASISIKAKSNAIRLSLTQACAGSRK